ncbi:helix-turn-helix domain-containing protein [Niabella beijingensis]|uniref:helix-turn-helix domain-containing protein n=1 Tax=Niabella beijingensis TaxID=2872700 RepID=UPI001CBD7C6C|nr:helix-turn-helix transcriptional regulator [Niabella beijingensis]MBZ4191152.1 AraC family transcriptional regulator [Niabella beijingensis]
MKSKGLYPKLELNTFQETPEMKDSVIYHRFDGASSIEKPHSHDFFVLLLFEKGSGIHSIDFIDHKVNSSQIHILFPGQIHKWDLGTETLGHKLIIGKHLFERAAASVSFSVARYNQHSVINLEPEVFRKVVAEFLLIQKELGAQPVFWDVISLRCSLIATMVHHQAERVFEDMIQLRNNPVLYHFHNLVEQHFREHKSVSFYAEQLNVTPNYLSILCKKKFRMPAIALIQQRVILEAKKLIHASDISVKEIAFELGFRELAHFSFFFKSKTGLSPRQYQNQLQ